MIHATAIIHPNAQLADDVEIGPYAVVGEHTVIGRGVRIGAHAVVENAEVGEYCTIYSHAAVGTAPQDLKYKGEPTKLILGPRCMVREFTTLNRGSAASGKTIIGADCLLMAYTHIAHDCVVGNNVIMANAATLGGHVEVGERAVISSMVAVHQFCKIGKLAMIGGGSMVSLDVLPYAQAQGDRARLVGLNLVGMRRKPMNSATMDAVKSAYRVLFLSGLPLEDALDQLEASSPCQEVRDMIDFVHASKRGICRHGRKKNNTEEA